jgi:putative FmdB family regulatory protein
VAAAGRIWHHWHSTAPSANATTPRKEYAVPTYQYSCTACGEPLEVVQSFTDDALTECPACGGRLRKLYNAVGIVFKGSGFYRTDSRSGSSATVPASSGSTGSESSSGKSDSAAATSTPSAGSSGSTPPTPSAASSGTSGSAA